MKTNREWTRMYTKLVFVNPAGGFEWPGVGSGEGSDIHPLVFIAVSF
ncbi:MAG TPA: hypothetical protein VF020_03495 [Chthoniobacterales bacterium]